MKIIGKASNGSARFKTREENDWFLLATIKIWMEYNYKSKAENQFPKFRRLSKKTDNRKQGE